MGFILGCILIYCVFKLLNSPNKPVVDSTPYPNGIGPCHLHKWDYDNGRLRCTACKGYPGEF